MIQPVRIAAPLAILLAASAAVCGAAGPVFLARLDVAPSVEVSWPAADGKIARHKQAKPFTAAEQRQPIGGNLDCFVNVGGTRLDSGMADPRGVIVRIGFYKRDNAKPLFDGLADDAVFTVRAEGLRFSEAPRPLPDSMLVHARFDDPTSVLGCVLLPNNLNLYLTTAPDDTLGGKVTSDNGRPGALSKDKGAAVKSGVAEDGSAWFEVSVPYRLFKHVDDPTMRTTPGSFEEPFHFHVEMEVIPVSAGQPQRPGDQKS